MALLYQNLKKVFIHTPRTGGTSFEWAIRKEVPGSQCVKFNLQNSKKHYTFEQLREISKPFHNNWRSWDVITFTRNPWDMVLSWFLFYNSGSPQKSFEREDFPEFISLCFIKGSTMGLFPHDSSNPEDNSLLSYFGDSLRNIKSFKFESYKGSFKAASRLFAGIPLHPENFAHTHKTVKSVEDKADQINSGMNLLGPQYWSNGGDYVLGESTYREFYTKQERNLVYSYTADYCDRFDYEF